jgi:hypothetical protein
MCELYVTCEWVDPESCNLGCKVNLPRSFTTLGGLPSLYGFKYDNVTAPIGRFYHTTNYGMASTMEALT